MVSPKRHRLILETLEPRRLLSGFWQGTDVDGDLVMIELTGRGELVVQAEDEGLGRRIDEVGVFDTGSSSKLIISTVPADGDGMVDIAAIDAAGEKLKLIYIDGYLGDLAAGSVRNIDVLGNLFFDEGNAQWFIDGKVRQILVYGSLENIDIAVGGNLKEAIVEGDMVAASLLVDGKLLNLEVYGDIADDSVISVAGRIKNVAVYGYLDASTIDTADKLNFLYVGRDIVDSLVQADGGIRAIVVDGGMAGAVVQSAGGMGVIDVWDWIEDSEIVAGDRGIKAIFAYNLSDTNISTTGKVGHIFLDAYRPYECWDNLVVIAEDGWYWPIYDTAYVDVVYYDDYVSFYYDEYYWDTYTYDPTYYDYYYDEYYGGDYYIYDDYFYSDYDYYIDVYYDDWYGGY